MTITAISRGANGKTNKKVSRLPCRQRPQWGVLAARERVVGQGQGEGGQGWSERPAAQHPKFFHFIYLQQG